MVVKEVVVYVVHERDLSHLAAASAAMDAFLSTREGFLKRTVHRDAKDPRRFMDIVRMEKPGGGGGGSSGSREGGERRGLYAGHRICGRYEPLH